LLLKTQLEAAEQRVLAERLDQGDFEIWKQQKRPYPVYFMMIWLGYAVL
jgi:hypothetical protein